MGLKMILVVGYYKYAIPTGFWEATRRATAPKETVLMKMVLGRSAGKSRPGTGTPMRWWCGP
jgi:hypothetical protein